MPANTKRSTVALAMIGLLAACSTTGSAEPASHDGPAAEDASAVDAAAPGGAPTRPPARICGSKSLRGPAKAPPGARVVSPGQDLGRAASHAPSGATFWLARHAQARTGRVRPGDPQGRATYIGAPGAILDGQKRNRYAFTRHAAGVTVKNLTIQNFGGPTNSDEGVVNHDAGDGWTIEDNTISNNAGAGVMVGGRNVVRGNCLQDNGQYGFNAYSPNGVTGRRHRAQRDRRQQHRRLGDPEARLRLHRRREVLGDHRRR